MILNKAVTLNIEAQLDLAHPEDHILPLDVSLPATVLAGITAGVDRGMELVQVRLHRITWGVAAVSPDRLGDINRGAEEC